MSSSSAFSNTHVRTKTGELKFVGGAVMARKRAVTLGKSTRILRPDERQRLNEGLPSGLNPFERFFAGLLRSEASEFLYEGTGTWNSICKRLKLPCPTEPIKAYYGDQKLHFAYRASLVIEEARFSIANGIMAMHKRSQNTNPNNNNNNNNKLKNNNANGRRESRSDVMSVSLVNVEPREKTGHTVLTFAIKRKGPISPEELSNLRHGQVFACVSQKLAPTVTNAHLGCILPGNREEIIETKSFQVMVFKSIKKTSGGTLWDLTPITSLLTEQRKFEACTSDITRSVPFLYPLLGGKGPTHIRFEEDSNGDTVSVNVKGEESSAEEDGDLVSPVSEEDMKLVFNAPRLNKIQERAASTFLNAEPNTITLIQGPPGTGKTTLLVSLICRYLMQSIKEGSSRSIMVCAPTNKAISVLCTRFLDSIVGDERCNIVLVGDDVKLLDDDFSRNRHGGESSKLRSIFLYTWINTVLDDYGVIRRYLTNNYRDHRDGHRMCALSRRLERRLQHSLSGLSREFLDAMSSVTKWLELDTSTNGGGSSKETLNTIQSIVITIRDWKKDAIWADLLRSAHVIFCTLASAGASIMKKSIGEVTDLVVDEAAASTEPEMYIPFHFRPQRLLAVGDPKQLPATVVSQLAEDRGLSKSLHERLMFDCNYKHIMLDVQYRMKPELSQFPSNHFYNGKLSNGGNVVRSDYLGKARLLNGQTYSFLQVTGFEKQAQSGSFENQAEAHVVVELVQELQQNSHRNCVPGKWHSADRIRIITFYQAQVFLIKRLLFNRRLHDVVVATVDSSQGCEADIVIVSFVRSHGSHGKSSVGFLTDDRRMNVAITRAKYQLICVGNAERMTTLSDPKAATVKTLASDAMDRESVIFPNSSRGEVNNQKRVNETRKEKRKKKKKRKKNKEEPKHMQEKVSGNPSRQLSTHSMADGGSNDDGRRSDDVSLAGPDESTDKEELNDQMVTTEAERPIVLEGRPGAQARDLESVDINRGGKVDDSINAKRGAIEMHTNYDSDIDLFSIASADSDVADSRCSIIDKKEYINPDEEITNAAAAKIDRTETIDLTKPTDLNNSVDGSFITADGRRSDDISLAGSDESTDKEELNDRKGSLRQRVVSDAETESNLQSGSIYSLIDI